MTLVSAAVLRRTLGVLAVLAGFAGLRPAEAQPARPQEYEVKAAYLYSFGKFVEWPVRGDPAAAEPFLVCVLGEDPFGPSLDATVENAVVRDRPVNVRRVTTTADALGCQVVFIGASEDTALDGTLAALGHGPVLTVGESPRFVERGGMVQFVVQASRVRFAVNLAAAEAAGLQLSSELLRVATNVIGARPAGR